MINIKNIAKGFLLLFFLLGAVIATRAEANNTISADGFLNAQASLKADALIKLENSVGVVLGSNGALRVLGAKVTAVSGSDISATAPFGSSSLNFVVTTDANTRLNGKLLASGSLLNQLKAGDRISFAGTITSSTSSSISVHGDHVISRVFIDNSKTNFSGKIEAVNTADNSFTLNLNGRTVKVSASSGAAVTLNGAASTIASLQAGDQVKITGDLNADGSVITASKIIADRNNGDNNNNNDNNNNGDHGNQDKNENKGDGFWGKIKHWFGR
jgi:hypothetical protein